MDPGALLADVGELEEVGVQPARLQRALEQRLVRARRARGDDHAREPLFLDRLGDDFLRILRAGKEELLRVDDLRQGGSVLDDRRHVDR